MKINEIFKSIQGESTYAGLPCTFIRLAGCNLRCTYCDTNYAYYHGKDLTDEEIIAKIKEYGVKLIEFTGGEPLLQEETPKLLKTLLDNDYTVHVETNGSICIGCLDKRLNVIMDFKTPKSGMSERMRVENFKFLKRTDQIKFVLMDESDYTWAKDIIVKHDLLNKFDNILMSPAYEDLSPKPLVSWVLRDNLPVRVQLQIHKYIWAPDEREGI
ncbi:MAG: radical SAM protein [Nitrospiraceae bacterium]|nr:MAG: radical SAM protein [Nitrospiraceae bacterium]